MSTHDKLDSDAEFARCKDPMKLRPVEPVGTERSYCHMNRGDQPHTWEYVDFPVYPKAQMERAKALRKARVDADLGLRDGAKLFGLRPVEMSGLERGSLTVDDNEWEEMLATIERAGKKDHG